MGRLGLRQVKGLEQGLAIADAFVHVGVLGVFRAQHKMVFWKPGIRGKALQLLQGGHHSVQALGRSVCKAGHFNRMHTIDPQQDLGVPGHESAKRVGAKRTFTGQADRCTRQRHADVGFFARRIELRARPCQLTRERAQLVGVIAVGVHQMAAQCGFERLAHQVLFAMLRQKGDGTTLIKTRHGQGHVSSVWATARYSGMPSTMFKGKVSPRLNPKYSAGLASGKAVRSTAGTAM